MIRMFVYLIFFGLVAFIFLNIFDVEFGKWYINVHLKDYIVEGLKGKLLLEEGREEMQIKRKVINGETGRQDIYEQRRSYNSQTESKDVGNIKTEFRKGRAEKNENLIDDKNEKKDLEIDPIEKVIEKSFQIKENRR